MQSWHGLLQNLIRQRSVFEQEHSIVELVAAQIERLGLEPIRVRHDPARLAALPSAQEPFSQVRDRCSLVVRRAGAGGGRSLVFNVHLDIVPEGDVGSWTRPPFAGEIDGERNVIYGRGAMDDKAGVAIALAVLETLVVTGIQLAGDVVFHFVLEDEIAGNGTLLCLAAGHGGDAVVIIDGTRPDRAIDRHTGQLQFDVHAKGRPASVSVSHLGINAGDLLARFVARLADRVSALNDGRQEPWTRFPSPFQFVTQRLVCEGSTMTVPDHAEGRCYVTFPPPWTLARMRRFLEDEARDFSKERGLSDAIVLDYCGFEAEPVVADSAGLGALVNACAADVGWGPVDVGPSTGTSDLRHFAAEGIPGLLYGPGTGFNPHRADEHYYLGDLAPMVTLFSVLAVDWCGGRMPAQT